MGVLEAMAEESEVKTILQEMRRSSHDALTGIDVNFPAMIREAANQMIANYAMTNPADVSRIEPTAEVLRNKWEDLPQETRERILALMRRKLSLEFDPTMVDEDWR